MKVGMVYGRERMHDRASGARYATVEHGCADGTDVMREVLMDEAECLGLDVDEVWINEQIFRLLRMYEVRLMEWRQDRQCEVGFVYEMGLPSGRKLLLGEPLVLAKVNMVH